MAAGAFLSLQTRQIRNTVKGVITETIASAVAAHTRAVCRIENVSGNLFSGFTVTGVNLTDAATGDLLLKADRIDVSYILPMLLKKTLWISRLSISGLSVALISEADGHWNMGVLLPSPSSPPSPSFVPPSIKPEPRTSVLPVSRIRLRRLEVQNSNVLLASADDSGKSVHRFTGIECRARVDMNFGGESDVSAAIDHLAVSLDFPEINITRLSGGIHYDMNRQRFDFKNTAIKGEKSDFTINGSLAILNDAPNRTVLDRIVMDLRASVDAMSLGEFGRAFPIEMPDTDIVYGDLSVKGPVSRMDCQVDLRMDKCHVVSQGRVAIDELYRVGLDINGRISGLDLSALPALNLHFLPGDLNTDAFSLKWRHIGWPEQNGRIVLHLTPSVLSGYAIDTAKITTEIDGADMNFKPLEIKTPCGSVSGSLGLGGIMSGKADKTIQIDAAVKNLNPAKLLRGKRYSGGMYSGDINGDVEIAIHVPRTYDVEGITAEAVCRMDASTVMGVDIQRADAEGVWDRKTVTVKRLDIKTAFGSADIAGDASVKDRTCRLKALASLPDVSRIRPFLPEVPKDAVLSGNLSMTADVTGAWSAPDITAAIEGRDMTWNRFSADSLAAQGKWRGTLKDFSASADTSLKNARMDGFQVSSAHAATALTPAAIHTDLDFQRSGKERLTLSGDIHNWMGPVKQIEISKMTLAAFDQSPLVNDGPLKLTLSPDSMAVDSMRLTSGAASLSVKGKARLTAPREVTAALMLRDLDIARISGFLAGGDKLKGRIASDINLSGVLENPVIQMNLSVGAVSFDKYSISEASAAISYADSKATLSASVSRDGKQLVDASGAASVSLSLAPFACTPAPESLNMRLHVDDIDISWISGLIDHPEYGFTGRLSATANVSGNFSKPEVRGRMRLAKGTLNLKKQGLTYETLTADLKFDENSIVIDDVDISGDKEGALHLSGTLTHDRFVPKSFDLKADGKNIYIPFHGGVKAWVNPALTLTGDWASPKVEGKIKVVRGRVDLDYFLKQQPSEIKIISADSAQKGVLEIPDAEMAPLSVFDPLAADISLDIPKDCWLRGKDAQVEINGNVQLKKDPQQTFVLFGSLHAVRGTYRFRGKLFQITQGTLSFVGQEDLNPPVNIEAQTEIGTVTIIIHLNGTFQHLTLTFDSDPPMDQSEIISYILFGRGTESLTDQETFKAEEMALSFTGQIAADKLKDVVGDALGIDYLNISTGSSGFRQGALSMGKYILPKVFVVFRQGFSDKNSQQFDVSYEINKYFDIQTQIDNEQTSALDLIWKYEF